MRQDGYRADMMVIPGGHLPHMHVVERLSIDTAHGFALTNHAALLVSSV